MGKFIYSWTLLKNIYALAREHQSYWLIPLVIILGACAFGAFASQAATPFIYNLF